MPSSTLNPEQIEAVNHGDGPLLIIAGAGTGKTTVITERVKHLIVDNEVNPNEILALTFTEKASREMEERIDIALPYGYTQLWVSTFHAFCDRILREEGISIGLNPTFRLTTEAEAMLFMRRNLAKLELDYFRPLGNPYKFIQGMLQHFSRLKDDDIAPDEYDKYVEKLMSDSDADLNDVKKSRELARAFRVYEELKGKEGIMDFSDLNANVLKLFRTRSNVLKHYQEKFKYILVDEFQDTNYAQNELAILLSGERKNITVVGDDDQAIYRWRGAALANIIQFREHFPDARIIALTKNYRSTAEILNKSYELVQHNNPDRLEVKEGINKKLESMRGVKGEPVEFLFGARVENEAEKVAEKITELVKKKKYSYSDFAILVRANDHSQPFARALERAQIPYQFLGPGHLFHQEEIKDMIAYLKVLVNFEDSTAMYRVLTNAIWGIEARDIAAILNFGKKKNYCLFEAMEHVDDTFLPELVKEQMRQIVTMIKRHLERIPRDSAGQILYYFFDDSGLLKQFLNPDTARAEKRAQNIAKFFEKLKSYEANHDDASVFAVVDWIDLAMELGESPMATDTDWGDMNAVNILTIHSSKGLEFPVVFVTNLVTQRFPSRERREQIPIPEDLIREVLPEGDANLQEERRLFYVAMTRAKDYLFLTAANYYGEGKRERKLSPFIAETVGQTYVDTLLQNHKEKASVQQLSLLDVLPKPAVNPEDEVVLATGQTASLYPVNFLSYSQIQTFEQCPLHYKLKYILKIPPFPSPALSFGTSVHAVLRDYFHDVIKGETPSEEMVETMLKRNWLDEGFESKSHEQSAYIHAREIIARYVKEERLSIPIATEIPFQFSVDGLKVGGRIDRVDKLEDGKIEIIDYKTGANIPTERDLAKNFQLTLYGLAAQEVRDEIFCKTPEEIILSLYYVESNTRLITIRTKEQLEEAKETLKQRADEISRSTFQCVGGMTCANCEYNLICQTFAK